MDHKPLKVNEIRELIHRGEATDPLLFLEAVMNGQDPRGMSTLHDLVVDIDEFSDGEPSKADWQQILEFVEKHCRYSEPEMASSLRAATALAEYLHPKRKQVDINTTNVAEEGSAVALTEEDVILFKEKWNDEF